MSASAVPPPYTPGQADARSIAYAIYQLRSLTVWHVRNHARMRRSVAAEIAKMERKTPGVVRRITRAYWDLPVRLPRGTRTGDELMREVATEIVIHLITEIVGIRPAFGRCYGAPEWVYVGSGPRNLVDHPYSELETWTPELFQREDYYVNLTTEQVVVVYGPTQRQRSVGYSDGLGMGNASVKEAFRRRKLLLRQIANPPRLRRFAT